MTKLQRDGRKARPSRTLLQRLGGRVFYQRAQCRNELLKAARLRRRLLTYLHLLVSSTRPTVFAGNNAERETRDDINDITRLTTCSIILFARIRKYLGDRRSGKINRAIFADVSANRRSAAKRKGIEEGPLNIHGKRRQRRKKEKIVGLVYPIK